MTPPVMSGALLTPLDVETLFADYSDSLHRVWSGESGVPAVIALVPGPQGTPAARVVIPTHHTPQEGIDAAKFLTAWHAECDDLGIPKTAAVRFERRPADAAASAWRQPPPIARPGPAAPEEHYNEPRPSPLARRLFASSPDPDDSALYPIYEAPQ